MSLHEIDNDSISSTATLENEFGLTKSDSLKVLKFISTKNFPEIEKIIPNYKRSKRFKKIMRG